MGGLGVESQGGFVEARKILLVVALVMWTPLELPIETGDQESLLISGFRIHAPGSASLAMCQGFGWPFQSGR